MSEAVTCKKNLLDVCLSMMKIGIIGFGGGNALIPVIEKTAVQEKHFLSKEDYDVDVMVASVTPGALPVEIAAGIGKRIAGLKGLILGAASMAFPGVFFSILCLIMLSGLSQSVLSQISFIMVGVAGFICCLLTTYIVSTFQSMRDGAQGGMCLAIVAVIALLICDKNLFRILPGGMAPVMALSTITVFKIAFFVVFFTRGKFSLRNLAVAAPISILYILSSSSSHIIELPGLKSVLEATMLLLSIYGVSKDLGENTESGRRGIIRRALRNMGLVFLVIFALAFALDSLVDGAVSFSLNGFLSSVMSFGGGDAYLTVADGLFVQNGYITEDDFYSAVVPVVNVLPGSILCKTLSGIGFYFGMEATGSTMYGLLAASLGFAVSVAASCMIYALVYAGYERYGHLRVFQEIRHYIRPIVSGLLINVMLALILQVQKLDNAFAASGSLLLFMFLIYGMALYFMYRRKARNEFVALFSIMASLVFCNAVMY